MTCVYAPRSRYYLIGPLDQGWFPDGLYTAANDAALRSDLVAMKKMGMNSVSRKRSLVSAFYTENHPFAKTGSGQTQGKHSKKERPFSISQVRKHMKVDTRRWYHHANTLGLLVWQVLLVAPIYTTNDHFAKTGSGQT